MSTEWKQGTFGCMEDCSTCKFQQCLYKRDESKDILSAGMFGCCCMPCTIYSTAESLDQSGILCMLLGCGMPWVATWILRGKAREKYGIEV